MHAAAACGKLKTLHCASVIGCLSLRKTFAASPRNTFRLNERYAIAAPPSSDVAERCLSFLIERRAKAAEWKKPSAASPLSGIARLCSGKSALGGKAVTAGERGNEFQWGPGFSVTATTPPMRAGFERTIRSCYCNLRGSVPRVGALVSFHCILNRLGKY